MKWSNRLAIAFLLMAPGMALAHSGHAESSFTAGAAHPFTGLDHLLAMIAVGVWAGRLGPRVVALPLTFLASVILGGALATTGLSLPLVEPVIAASVLVLGLILAMRLKLPMWPAMALIGLFAVFHGYAHMAEMGAGRSPAGYAFGFTLATIVLLATGVAIARLLERFDQIAVIRWAGAGVAACGLAFLVGIL